MKSYGAWRSPITTQLITAGSLKIGAVRSQNGYVYWNESRPNEGGRSVIVRTKISPTGVVEEAEDITPRGFNARTLVHEYGGGEYCVSADDVFFTNMSDQRIYRQKIQEGASVAATPPEGARRITLSCVECGRTRENR